MAKEAGLSESTLGDAIQRGVATTDKAVKIAAALGRSVDWLLTGAGSTSPSPVIAVEDADLVPLPWYDLSELTEAGKARRVETVPFRRDWLNRRLLTTTGLWLTELPSDYPAAGLVEGDAVICSDVGSGGTQPQEGWLCIVRGPGGPIVSRYSNRPATERAAQTDATGESFITAADLQSGDYQAIARIHARILAKL